VKQLLIPGMTDQLRAQLGNETAIKAFKEGKVPFPDGSIIAALHWTRIPAEADDKVLAGPFPGAGIFHCWVACECSVQGKGLKEVNGDGRLGFR
jgi:hypothetical protein